MPSVVFDVVGTCFSYDNGAKGFEEAMGDRLTKYGLSPKVVFYALVTSTERDYSYLSQINQYKPFHVILFGILRRTLYQLGVPAEVLEDPDFITKDELDHIYKQYMALKPREGLKEMFQILREGGFDVWACSCASFERVNGYFKSANVDLPEDHIISADSCGKGKPDPAVYKLARDAIGADKPGEISIFAASHAWDCAAARATGFATAYTTTYEWQECPEIFGEFDLTTPDLISLGKGIVEKWGKK